MLMKIFKRRNINLLAKWVQTFLLAGVQVLLIVSLHFGILSKFRKVSLIALQDSEFIIQSFSNGNTICTVVWTVEGISFGQISQRTDIGTTVYRLVREWLPVGHHISAMSETICFLLDRYVLNQDKIVTKDAKNTCWRRFMFRLPLVKSAL